MYWKGAIFDLDGTLADTLPVSYAAFRRTIRETTGATFTNREIHSRFGPSEEGVLAGLLLNGGAAEAYSLFLRLYDREHRRCPTAFPGVAALIRDLQDAGVRCAVVTGKGAESAEITLGRIGLTGMFEKIEAGSSGGAVKADCMRRVLEHWGLGPERVVSVGDFPSDVRAAKEVGLTPIGVAWASTANRGALVEAGAKAVFDRVDQLAAWLRTGC
jgi:phosphoglycolate phosphatase-like HAD superfamily hydrolase